jgi:hypothetical protein
MDKIGENSNYPRKAEYEKALMECEKFYADALKQLRIRGRDHIVQENILGCCFQINKRLFPIALKEGVLVMKEEMCGVMDVFMNPSATIDRGDGYQGGRRH